MSDTYPAGQSLMILILWKCLQRTRSRPTATAGAPYAFTEHGAIMAAMVLASPRAVEVSVYVVRAFVRLREAALQHKDLAERLASLEEKTESLAMQHDTFSRNTRAQLRQVFEALRELTVPTEPTKRPIGFVQPEEKKNKPASKTAARKKG